MLYLRALQALGGFLLLAHVAGARAWPQAEPAAPEQILRRAVELEQGGDLAAAIEQYEAFLAWYPKAAAVRFTLGNAYGQSGKFQEAIAHYEQALQSGDLKDPASARLILGWTYFQAGEFEKATDLLSGIVKQGPENREALQLLASSYLRLGKWQEVIELISPLESEPGESPDLAYLLGVALVEDGQVEKGAPLLESSLQHTDSAEVRFTLGRALKEKGDYFGALKHLERAIELDPTIPSLNATYGTLLRTLTRFDEADEAFLREIAINSGDYEANLFHGLYLYENEQKYDEALACFQRALSARPGDAAARFQMGLVYSYSNRIEEALQMVRGVVEENPDFLDGQVTLTGLYYRLGREGDAERHRIAVERLRATQDGQHLIRQGQFSQAVELYERQKRADPSDPRPYFYQGMALSQAQDWKGAVGEFKEAARLDPEEPKYAISHANALARTGERELARTAVNSLGKAPWHELDPRLSWLLSDTYYQIGEHDLVLEVLDFLAEQDPENANIDLMSGQIHLLKGDHERARMSAERGIQKQPANNGSAYSLLGTARYQLEDRPGAKEAFLKAVDQDPTNPDHLRRLGALCLELDEYEQAVKYLKRALPAAAEFPDIAPLLERAYQAARGATPSPVDPDQPPQPAIPVSQDRSQGSAEQLVAQAEAAIGRGEVIEAVKLLERAVELEPSHWVARSYLADIYLSQNRPGLAFMHLSEMEKIDPKSPLGLLLMAQYWYQRRDYVQALDYGVRAKAADPSNADLRNLLGNLYFSQGQSREAVEEYQAAVELEPERPEFRMNLEVARKRLP